MLPFYSIFQIVLPRKKNPTGGGHISTFKMAPIMSIETNLNDLRWEPLPLPLQTKVYMSILRLVGLLENCDKFLGANAV